MQPCPPHCPSPFLSQPRPPRGHCPPRYMPPSSPTQPPQRQPPLCHYPLQEVFPPQLPARGKASEIPMSLLNTEVALSCSLGFSESGYCSLVSLSLIYKPPSSPSGSPGPVPWSLAVTHSLLPAMLNEKSLPCTRGLERDSGVAGCSGCCVSPPQGSASRPGFICVSPAPNMALRREEPRWGQLGGLQVLAT